MASRVLLEASACSPQSQDPDQNTVLLAFSLTIGAGLATTIGSTAGCCVSLRNKKILAAGLSLSAGVMIYVSFVEILAKKSIEAFETSCRVGAKYAQLCAASCFFAGALTCLGLNALVHWMSGHHSHDVDEVTKAHQQPAHAGDVVVDRAADPLPGMRSSSAIVAVEQDVAMAGAVALDMVASDTDDTSVSDEDCQIPPGAPTAVERKKLSDTGVFTALAIAIHNFPEGLATFVATLDDPVVGVSIALAIAIHNVPEGICVAMPVYYATGSRCRSFWWSFLSGVTEPIGAAVGWFVLRSVFTDLVYGVLFGVVGGMMVYISLRELLPMAMQYDESGGKVTQCGLWAGMFVMALSLVLFDL